MKRPAPTKKKPVRKKPAGKKLQTPGKDPLVGFARTWEDLGAVCARDPKTLQHAAKQYAGEIRTRRLIRPDGRKHIAGWLQLIAEKGIQARGVNNTAVDSESEYALKMREWRLRLDRAEFELSRAKEQMLPVSEFESALGSMLAQFRAAGNAMVGRAAGKLLTRARAAILVSLQAALKPTVYAKVETALGKENAIDFADLEEVLQTEWELVLRTLTACDYF